MVLSIGVVSGTALASERPDPRDLVDTTIETLRKNVSRDAALLDGDPEHAFALVESAVAPHIDMRLASRLVLGKHWQGASENQRDAFVEGLRRLLLRIFATHIRDYSTATVDYSPTVLVGKDNQRAIVRTEVSRAGIPSVSVDYRLHHAHGEWKIYDVAIFGISLVKTYHLTIDGELQRDGLDRVIQRINALYPLYDSADVRLAEPLPAG